MPHRRKSGDSRPRRRKSGHHHHINELAAITRGEYEEDSDEDTFQHRYHRRDSRFDDSQFAQFHAYYSSDESHVSEETETDESDSDSDDRKRKRLKKQNTFNADDDLYDSDEALSEDEFAQSLAQYSTELRGTYKYAAKNNVTKVRQDLKDGKIDVDKPSIYNDMKTLLHVACEHGATDVAKLLVKRYKADLFATDRTDQTPMHIAAQGGKTSIVDEMVRAVKDTPALLAKLINGEDRYGMTPLMLATNLGRKRVVRYLLRQDDIDLTKKAFGGDHLDRDCVEIAQANIDDFGDTTRGENCVTIMDLLVTKVDDLRRTKRGRKKLTQGKKLFLKAIGHF